MAYSKVSPSIFWKGIAIQIVYNRAAACLFNFFFLNSTEFVVVLKILCISIFLLKFVIIVKVQIMSDFPVHMLNQKTDINLGSDQGFFLKLCFE